MQEITAVNNKVLAIDLSNSHITTLDISSQDRRQFLGGKGLALKLLHDHLPRDVDPLSPENILVMMSGPTAGTPAPAGGRFAVVCKSPLTGVFGSSYVGGRFGLSLKRAGYDGMLIKGKSDTPVTISIINGDVSIDDASDSWGMDTYDFQKERKNEGDWVVIGPAGENLVRFAIIAADNRIAGRSGLGAVMGSKNLKGIVAKGNRKFSAADPDTFKKAIKTAQKKVKSHEMTAKKLKELGTAQNVMIFGPNNAMPVRNYSKSFFENFRDISAETIRDKHRIKNHGCAGCPIQCGRIGKFKDKEMISPEYETISLMGSNLMIGDISEIAFWNEKLNRLGLDSISTGNVIGFAMELTEKGMLDTNLSFGKADNIDETLTDIAYRRGIGNDLAEGVKRLSEKYGGQEFAIHVKGLEMAAYDPRGCTGQGLGYATANSGATHLSGSTHAVEVDSYLSPGGTKGKAHFVKFMQDLSEVGNSSIFCVQTQYPFLEENFAYKYTPKLIMQALMRNLPGVAVATTDLSDYCGILSGLLGIKLSRSELYQIGERIFNLERLMICREGIGKSDDILPGRILNEFQEEGWNRVELDVMLKKYYELRGWDESGHPRPETLKRLGISNEYPSTN